MQEMRELSVAVVCMATYRSKIKVPSNLTQKEAIKYANEHLMEVPVGKLEYISDSDYLDEENCYFVD